MVGSAREELNGNSALISRLLRTQEKMTAKPKLIIKTHPKSPLGNTGLRSDFIVIVINEALEACDRGMMGSRNQRYRTNAVLIDVIWVEG